MVLDINEYKRWIDAALNTLESARSDSSRGDHNWACFKAQQAAELAVKALLRGIGSPCYGHSVARLVEHIGQILDIEIPEDIINCSKLLDKLYIPTRYPDAWSEGPPYYYYTNKDSAEAITCSENVVEWVKKLWNKLSSIAEKK